MSATALSSAPTASIALPLASGAGYVAAVLLIKRSSAHGVGLWRTAFVSNVAMGLCFSALWALGGKPLDWTALWQPAIGGALFFAGQVFTFMALAGDVSLATPVLGLKIIFVAAASSVLVAEPVRAVWWIAAALATSAIALLQSAPASAGPAPAIAGSGSAAPPPSAAQHPRRTIVTAAAAAACFALTDVLVQRFTPAWGVGRFLPLMFGMLAFFSLGLIPFFSAPLRAIEPGAWRWLAPGSMLLAIQAAGMAFTLGIHGRATAANILYSTRGLWSVLAVGLLGSWLGTAGERRLPRAIFRRRLIGSGLMFAAVALVLV